MANNKVQMKYDLCQNNVRDSVMNGKWYPRVSRTATLDLDGLCDHIAGHSSIYTGDVVAGVLWWSMKLLPSTMLTPFLALNSTFAEDFPRCYGLTLFWPSSMTMPCMLSEAGVPSMR